jgi:hyperosmotically inducible periplasmic protein
MKNPCRGIAVFAVAIALAGCTAMTGETAGRNIDDAAITAAVKTDMARDTATTFTSVDVDTVNATVYLTGTVADPATKERAGRIARHVDGVGKVVNNLQTRAVRAGDAPSR